MKVYAIHRERVWTTDYNVMLCSSKRFAERNVKVLNERYDKWLEEKREIKEYSRLNDGLEYMDFVYNNPQPPRYRIEKLEITK